MTRILSGIIYWLHWIGGVVACLVMLLAVGNIVGRYIFKWPVPGTIELTELSMVLIVFFGLAFAEQRKAHIAVDLIYDKLSPKGKSALDVLGSICNLIVTFLILWQFIKYAAVIKSSGASSGVLNIPIYPFLYIAIAGIASFILAIMLNIIQSFAVAKGARS